jgi:hypothetical protein
MVILPRPKAGMENQVPHIMSDQVPHITSEYVRNRTPMVHNLAFISPLKTRIDSRNCTFAQLFAH